MALAAILLYLAPWKVMPHQDWRQDWRAAAEVLERPEFSGSQCFVFPGYEYRSISVYSAKDWSRTEGESIRMLRSGEGGIVIRSVWPPQHEVDAIIKRRNGKLIQSIGSDLMCPRIDIWKVEPIAK